MSSLPPTPCRQLIPTLQSPQDLGFPGGSAPGPTWKVTGCPPLLMALSLPVPAQLPLLTSHANPLQHPEPSHFHSLPYTDSPLPHSKGRSITLSSVPETPAAGIRWPLGSAFFTGLILSQPMVAWVFCSHLGPEFRSGPKPGFCLGPRLEFGSCSLDDFRSN